MWCGFFANQPTDPLCTFASRWAVVVNVMYACKFVVVFILHVADVGMTDCRIGGYLDDAVGEFVVVVVVQASAPDIPCS